MFEDKWLKIRFNAGHKDALCRIYEKYRDDLLTLAMALLDNSHLAEDVLHDVFVTFTQGHGIHVKGNLKSYLATCVANRARDRLRARKRRPQNTEDYLNPVEDSDSPEVRVMANETSRLVASAMGQLPYEQREVIVLHLNAGMTFRQIARVGNTSISTAKGRYRYGIEKLRSILNGKL
jgi:RNA polymerase sigma-70 factor (ECF subfamily)